MNKETTEKILTPHQCLDVASISVEEKKIILSILAKKGFTTSTFYLRFFSKGFSSWEILGVKECKRQFLQLPDVAKALHEYIDDTCKDSLPGDRGYFFTLANSDKTGEFYRCLRDTRLGLCMKFQDFMLQHGMSPGTTCKRFTLDRWKEWELQGMRSILDDMIDNKV